MHPLETEINRCALRDPHKQPFFIVTRAENVNEIQLMCVVFLFPAFWTVIVILKMTTKAPFCVCCFGRERASSRQRLTGWLAGRPPGRQLMVHEPATSPTLWPRRPPLVVQLGPDGHHTTCLYNQMRIKDNKTHHHSPAAPAAVSRCLTTTTQRPCCLHHMFQVNITYGSTGEKRQISGVCRAQQFLFSFVFFLCASPDKIDPKSLLCLENVIDCCLQFLRSPTCTLRASKKCQQRPVRGILPFPAHYETRLKSNASTKNETFPVMYVVNKTKKLFSGSFVYSAE